MDTKAISIQEMMNLSNELYDLHKDSWGAKTPESNLHWICWLVAEIGEVIDIVKKKGVEKIMNDPTTRKEMLEEISDCYMFLADILNRYNYTPEEFSGIYREKMSHNLKRDFTKGKTKKDKTT